MKLLGVLDRYVLRQWTTTFVLSALGIPAVAVLINLSDQFGKLTTKGVPVRDILVGYLYFFPFQIALLFPAAVLFATVFTLNALGRHSELTAAKAGGISFLRLVMPLLLLATLAIPVNFGLQELAAISTIRQRQLHREGSSRTAQFRSNATYASTTGWTYGASDARREIESEGKRLAGRLYGVLIDGPKHLGDRAVLVADSAIWSPSRQNWMLYRGTQTSRNDSTGMIQVIRFATMEARALTEPPRVMIEDQKKAEEMSYLELREYIGQLRQAAAAPGALEVDLYLKLALPVACLIVALFGAPLAVTNPRAGAALGLAMALGTTLVYLTGTQIMKAVGGKGMIDPILAAWSMNILFGVLAVVLISRVKS